MTRRCVCWQHVWRFLFRGETRGCEDVCMGWCEGGACVERASSLMLFNRELRLHVTRQAVPLESQIPVASTHAHSLLSIASYQR